jgi:hypothetical protein
LLKTVGDWGPFFETGYNVDEIEAQEIRRHELAGRALGEKSFLEGIERVLQRPVRKRTVGRKKKARNRYGVHLFFRKLVEG